MSITHTFFNLVRCVVMQHTSVRLPIGEGLSSTRLVWDMEPASISFTLTKQRPASMRIVVSPDLINGESAKKKKRKEDREKSSRKGQMRRRFHHGEVKDEALQADGCGSQDGKPAQVLVQCREQKIKGPLGIDCVYCDMVNQVAC